MMQTSLLFDPVGIPLATYEDLQESSLLIVKDFGTNDKRMMNISLLFDPVGISFTT